MIRITRRALLAWAALAGPPAAAWPRAGIGGPFTLQNSTGQIVTADNFRGKFLLIMFGYTNCPDVCPASLYKIAQALQLLGPQADRLTVLFVSIDPARDTPELTARYAALFSPRIIGLSGSAAQVQQMAAAFHVYVGQPDPHTGAIAHGDLLYLMNENGDFVTAWPSTLPAAQLADKLRQVSAN